MRSECLELRKAGARRCEAGSIATSEAIERRRLASRVGVAEFSRRKISVAERFYSNKILLAVGSRQLRAFNM